MSQQERQRLGILVGVKAGEWGLVAAAAVLGLSCRPPKRVWQRNRTEGDPGRVPRRRGQPGLRRKPAKLRARSLARVEKQHPDLGPPLAAASLAKDGLTVAHEPVRRWLLAGGPAPRAAAAATPPARA